MELNQLETFLAVAEERSFSRAAQRVLPEALQLLPQAGAPQVRALPQQAQALLAWARVSGRFLAHR